LVSAREEISRLSALVGGGQAVGAANPPRPPPATGAGGAGGGQQPISVAVSMPKTGERRGSTSDQRRGEYGY
jgi:hypothetical protein